MARVRFLGGTSTVTGSKFLVEHGDGSVLVDCGMFQGKKKLERRNWNEPYFADGLPDEVLITHAHIDHTGWLPRLVGHYGFSGPIKATRATADLLGIMLPDSARIQEEHAAYANKKGYCAHKFDPCLPLYTQEDAAKVLTLLEPVDYHGWVETPVGSARFTFAGHILGSAHITLEMDGRTAVFSGDIGRWDIPVIKDPEPPEAADLVLMESTYGDRSHNSDLDPDSALADVVQRVVASGGTLVIPAFSLGRTQELLFRLRALEDEGRIPELPVFLDSPMAINATELYRSHHEEHDIETTRLEETGDKPLSPALLKMTRSVDQSKALNSLKGPAIIIAASGMATAGRVVHHLKRLLPDRRNIVAFVGYQAVGTRGRSMVDGASRIKIHGQFVQVRAEVVRLDAFSAHADASELVRWLRSAVSLPRRVALVHGEQRSRDALAVLLREQVGVDVVVPRHGQVVNV